MELTHIEVLLSVWGRWALRVETRAIGYASVSPMFRDSASGGSYGSELPVGVTGEDIRVVDAAVTRLPVIYRAAIHEFYKNHATIRALALHLGCTHKSASQYLNEARRRVDHEMAAIDRASGLRGGTT